MAEHQGEKGSLRGVMAQAVADGLVDAGDGSYVTSFDTAEDAEVVIERVTDRLMDLFFPEDGSPAPMVVQLRECVLRLRDVKAELDVWRAIGGGYTHVGWFLVGPEGDIGSSSFRKTCPAWGTPVPAFVPRSEVVTDE